MSATTTEVYERTLAAELEQGTPAPLARARARAAQLRAQHYRTPPGGPEEIETVPHGSPENRFTTGIWASARRAFLMALGQHRNPLDGVYELTLASELADGSSRRVARGRARATRIRARQTRTETTVENEIYQRTLDSQQAGGRETKIARARAEAARLRARHERIGDRP